ncbi:MAG: SufD family Fe-S cluster assembly protein [Candidatus Ancillula sp.]|jgi:Fe-S cluster assembly protein SufD|nr:SufD family Fe-S cluster assembly protein [Candidatus Ancillula sp.]
MNEDLTQVVQISEGESRKFVILQFGDDDYKSNLKIELIGEGASVEVQGLYFAGSGQNIQNRVTIMHKAKNCKSRVLYKGVLKDKGTRTNWVGTVKIEPEATGTDTYEENRNLLLTRGVRALSEPNLEILTGDIENAGHASATGRFDDEQLFYLMSRGISKKDAKRLVVEGFFGEVLNSLKDNNDISEQDLEKIQLEISTKLSA